VSKAVLLVTIPLVAGLAAWNLVLSSEVEELRVRVGESAPPRPAAKPDPGAAASPSAREAAVRTDPRMAEVQATLVEMRRELDRRFPSAGASPDAAPPSGEAGSDEETADVAVPAEWDSEAFRVAVGRVLDAREVERRQDRSARLAENLARNWFRDMTLTPSQRSDALRVIADSLRKLEDVRQDPTLSEDERRENLQRVQEDRLASLAGILDAAQMETVRTRAGARLRRGMGDAGPGGRGAERRGAGADEPR
jgi:hypothetical protein